MAESTTIIGRRLSMPPSLRQRITNWRWFPKSLLGRLTAYILALDIFLYLLQRLLGLFGPRGGASLEGWIDFLSFIAAVLVFLVFVRWLRNDLMWRLRNRLIVTYVFMAVVPILLLVAMAAMAGYIFAGQFATFIVTSDIRSELNNLEAGNNTLAETLATQLRQGQRLNVSSVLAAEGKQTGHYEAAWYRGKSLLQAAVPGLGSPPPAFAKNGFRPASRWAKACCRRSRLIWARSGFTRVASISRSRQGKAAAPKTRNNQG